MRELIKLNKNYKYNLNHELVIHLDPDYVYIPIKKNYNLLVKSKDLVLKEQIIMENNLNKIISPISGVAKDEIESLLSKLSADSQLEEWSREIITIKNKTGVVINAKFKGINHIQSTLFIASADQKRLIIVMVEAPDPNVRNLLNTFTLDKIEKDAVTYFESTKK